MSYIPPYRITPKIIDLVSKISEAVGSFYAQEELRLHPINRIKTIQGSLAIEGNTLTIDQITAILDGKPVIAPINEVQEIRNAIKAYELLESNTPHSTRDKIIEQIRNNPKITRNELASILGITSDGVKYHLQKMTIEGIIVRHGLARGGHWEIR